MGRLNRSQAHPPERFALHSERLGTLPLVNHFLERMGLPALLERYVPTPGRRSAVSHAQALGVLLRSIVVDGYQKPQTFAAERGRRVVAGVIVA